MLHFLKCLFDTRIQDFCCLSLPIAACLKLHLALFLSLLGDFANHGPLLFIHVSYRFYFPIVWAVLVILFVWIPWYSFTEDPAYPILGAGTPNAVKLGSLLPCKSTYYLGL